MHARRMSGKDVAVLFDQIWMHRAEGVYWADQRSFEYCRHSPRTWLKRARRCEAEVADVWFHQYEPRDGDVVIDVGAGAGEQLPPFVRRVGSRGHVIAVEAHPTTYTMLERMVSRNRFQNATCIHSAIVHKPCKVRMTDVDVHIGNSVVFDGDHKSSIVEVDGVPLDQLCRRMQIDRIDFLKMNIEGAEKMAICGMQECIKKTRHLAIACHDFRTLRGEGDEFRSKNEVLGFLSDHDFDISVRDDDERDWIRYYVYGRNRTMTDGRT